MNLDRLLNEDNMVKIAWGQAYLSLPCLLVFPFLSLQYQVLLLGIVTMLTWTGTALNHISAARANREVVLQKNSIDVDVDVGKDRESQ